MLNGSYDTVPCFINRCFLAHSFSLSTFVPSILTEKFFFKTCFFILLIFSSCILSSFWSTSLISQKSVYPLESLIYNFKNILAMSLFHVYSLLAGNRHVTSIFFLKSCFWFFFYLLSAFLTSNQNKKI